VGGGVEHIDRPSPGDENWPAKAIERISPRAPCAYHFLPLFSLPFFFLPSLPVDTHSISESYWGKGKIGQPGYRCCALLSLLFSATAAILDQDLRRRPSAGSRGCRSRAGSPRVRDLGPLLARIRGPLSLCPFSFFPPPLRRPGAADVDLHRRPARYTKRAPDQTAVFRASFSFFLLCRDDRAKYCLTRSGARGATRVPCRKMTPVFEMRLLFFFSPLSSCTGRRRRRRTSVRNRGAELVEGFSWLSYFPFLLSPFFLPLGGRRPS